MRNWMMIGVLMLSAVSLTAQEMAGTVVEEGANPVKVASGFSFTEGPAADRTGNVYFTDQPNNRIHKWTPGDGVTVFLENAGRANGLYVDRKGNLYACADARNELWMIDKKKRITVLVDDYGGKVLNGPNDLWIAPSAAIYFTDPYYQRPYWTRNEKEIADENVYYLSPNRKELKIASGRFTRPNGIVGSPDGRLLYVADLGAGKTWSFRIMPDGSLTDRKLFAPMGSDGMTIDAAGNVYLTGNGVTVFNKSGEKIAHIPVDEPWTANVCFGGKDRKTLFITASSSVYTLRMNVKGTRQ